MTLENTYNNKQQAEEKPQDMTPKTERRFLTQEEYNQRWKQLFEGSGTLYLGTSTQAQTQRALNGEPPASNNSMNISLVIGGGPPRRRQPTEETSKKEDTL